MKIVFVSGTRADYGKLKPLMQAAMAVHKVEVFVTGMHLSELHGSTWTEIKNDGFHTVRMPNNMDTHELALASTIQDFSTYLHFARPDLIVVHGDRGEALAAAIVGAFTNTIVCHIEGGEVSGTVDEHLRHAISKLSHIHCVTNEAAKQRLLQMGEIDVHVIGSPDVDLLLSDSLPSLSEVKSRYQIPFDQYGILIYHPVTTEDFRYEIKRLVDSIVMSNLNYVVIYPNNDSGYELILQEYHRLGDKCVKYSSMRFEYFLTLLKHADLIVGNSSCGIMEAPYYGVPAINVGSRQEGRGLDYGNYAINCDADQVVEAIGRCKRMTPAVPIQTNSAKRFLDVISTPREVQKRFYALDS
jgi:UDP-N-acetylglucosamine 2-epimerase (hydrolysing)